MKRKYLAVLITLVILIQIACPIYAIDGKSDRDYFYDLLFELNQQQKTATWIGESITEGNNYDEKIAKIFPNINHVDKGIGGNTSKDVINRLYNIKSTQANLYVVAIGVNDIRYNDSRGATSKESYISNMATIIDNLQAVGKVVVIGIWPHFYPDQYAALGLIETDKRIDEYNIALENLCKQKNVPFINPTPSIRKIITSDAVPLLIPDGIHPVNDTCKQLYADAVLKVNLTPSDYLPKQITGLTRVSKITRDPLSTTFSKIKWDRMISNGGLNFDTTNNRFIAEEDGVYRIDVFLSFENIDPNTRIVLSAYKNGIEQNWVYDSYANQTRNRFVNTSFPIFLEDGETFELWGYTSATTYMDAGTAKMNMMISKQ